MKFRTIAELVIGVLYALGTIHQGLFVLRSSEDFYLTMADRAWFQGLLAIAILSRGPLVAPALVAGGIFSLVGAFTGNPAETIGYVGLAGIHFWLAATH
jgi:hypothetical protein